MCSLSVCLDKETLSCPCLSSLDSSSCVFTLGLFGQRNSKLSMFVFIGFKQLCVHSRFVWTKKHKVVHVCLHWIQAVVCSLSVCLDKETLSCPCLSSLDSSSCVFTLGLFGQRNTKLSMFVFIGFKQLCVHSRFVWTKKH